MDWRTEYLLEVVPPDEGSRDVGKQVGSLVVVLSGDVAVGDAAEEGEGLEGQHGHHLSIELGSDHVDDHNHQQTHDYVALEGGEGHLLTQCF